MVSVIEPVAAIAAGPPDARQFSLRTPEPWDDAWPSAVAVILLAGRGVSQFATGIATDAAHDITTVWLDTWAHDGADGSQRSEKRVLRAAVAHIAAGLGTSDIPAPVLAAVALDAFVFHHYSLLHRLFEDDFDLLLVGLPSTWEFDLHRAAALANVREGNLKTALGHLQAVALAPQHRKGDPRPRGSGILSRSIARTCNELLQQQLLAGAELIPGLIAVSDRLHDIDVQLGDDTFGSQYLALQFLWHRQNPDQPPAAAPSPVTGVMEAEYWGDEHVLGAGSVQLADLSQSRPITDAETDLLIDGLKRVSPTDTFLSTPSSATLIASALVGYLGEPWANHWGHHLLEQYGPVGVGLQTIDKFTKLTT